MLRANGQCQSTPGRRTCQIQLDLSTLETRVNCHDLANHFDFPIHISKPRLASERLENRSEMVPGVFSCSTSRCISLIPVGSLM